jgi:hypothetical protein
VRRIQASPRVSNLSCDDVIILLVMTSSPEMSLLREHIGPNSFLLLSPEGCPCLQRGAGTPFRSAALLQIIHSLPQFYLHISQSICLIIHHPAQRAERAIYLFSELANCRHAPVLFSSTCRRARPRYPPTTFAASCPNAGPFFRASCHSHHS